MKALTPDNVLEAVDQSGMAWAEICRRTGLSGGSIKHWRAGASRATPATLRSLAKVLEGWCYP